jgi:hypothetical protein
LRRDRPQASRSRHTKAETFRAALSGRTDAGGGWLRVQLERPGVLLLRRLGPRRAEGAAVAMRWPVNNGTVA